MSALKTSTSRPQAFLIDPWDFIFLKSIEVVIFQKKKISFFTHKQNVHCAGSQPSLSNKIDNVCTNVVFNHKIILNLATDTQDVDGFWMRSLNSQLLRIRKRYPQNCVSGHA